MFEDQIEKLEIQLRNAEAEKAALTRNVHLLQSQLDISGHKAPGVSEVQSRIDSVSINVLLSSTSVVRDICLNTL